ncbi:site-2 protease family protein [Luteolibacter luteus]|uniref:Peptidase M50 domain-containing protein n=1 Tax=Luteolibacter luteus TaxID=2728835 RepID=A0A858RNM3_9BACT|nr:site-2 protease family protein [Luteolibacter luteus]QJE97543.1 hypothetical protein HHL09_17725 [Luteolibacter luteus]
MVRFTLFGIPVEIQPWFWITLAILGAPRGGDGATQEGILVMFLFVLAGFISILVHELGHALTGRKFGAQTAITLHAFGGYAIFPAARFSRWQDFLVTAAGPAVQIVLGVIFFFIYMKTRGTISPFAAHFLGDLAGISIFWAVLNLIPVIPLDGGRLLVSILGPSRIELSLKVSMGVAIAGAVALFASGKGPFFALFLALFAFQNWQELNHRRRS